MSPVARVVQTVRGPVAPESLGITMAHEHLWMDATPLLSVHGYYPGGLPAWDAGVAAEARWNPGVHPDNYRLNDVDAAVDELAPFVAAGGATVVELTPPSLGRNVLRVREIAERTGINVIQGTGHYLEATHEPWLAEAGESAIARRLVADAMVGMDGTGIRAGIFGEIGTSNPVTPAEKRVLRASASAASETGRTISVHLHPWGHEGAAVLDALVAAGGTPSRIILGHLNTAIDRLDELRTFADRGAILGFDLFGFDHSLLGPGRWPPSDRDAAMTVVSLIGAGYRDQIVLGQDIGVRTRYRRWGGWGYAHLLEHVVPLLRELGASAEDVDAMLVGTPARLLSVPA